MVRESEWFGSRRGSGAGERCNIPGLVWMQFGSGGSGSSGVASGSWQFRKFGMLLVLNCQGNVRGWFGSGSGMVWKEWCA